MEFFFNFEVFSFFISFVRYANGTFILIAMPLVVMGIMFFVPAYDFSKLRLIALVGSLLTFIFSITMVNSFDHSMTTFQHTLEMSWLQSLNIHFYYGVDGISLFFVLLTTFLIPICILSSWVSIKFRVKEFLLMLLLVEFFLLNVFMILDLVLFYIFFEGSLIPMFIIIGVWGSRDRKIHAAYQFFLYTFLGSVMMLVAILFILANVGSTDYYILLQTEFTPSIQKILWLAFFASFAVKIPMVPVHIWLPEAHVEAPTAGSVLLAGVLLKLGTYGLLRFSLPLFPQATIFFTPLVFAMSVIAIIYTSCTTLRQIDLKKIIAYTSVAHMNLVTIGIVSQTQFGVEGSIFLMLSHGLVSSALFLCVGVVYDRYGTRILRYYGGLASLMPIYATLFLIFSLANMGLPGTSSFVGEFLILLGAFCANTFVCFLASLGTILSAAYSIWLFNRVSFGPVSPYIVGYSDLNHREFFILGILAFLVILFGVYSEPFLGAMHSSVSANLLSSFDWPVELVTNEDKLPGNFFIHIF